MNSIVPNIREKRKKELKFFFGLRIKNKNEGMYFKLYMNGLQPERYYRILFKHINNDGTEIFDNNYHFKVIR